MVKFISFLFVFLSFSISANTYKASLSKIDLPQYNEEETLLLLDDGNVIKLKALDSKSLNEFQALIETNKILRLETTRDRYLKSWEVIGEKTFDEKKSLNQSYTPTVLNSSEEAANIFKNLRRGATSYSQCYNRAHIWSYESKNKFNLDSMKVFMFYTRKYIREYNFGWWFHVAPFTYVKENGEPVEKVLDFRFTKQPTGMKAWTDTFMKNKVHCPVITKYSEYENHQEAQYCYLYKASMYYVQPLDLENLEGTGKTKTEFLTYEINRAYRNGFGMWW